MVRALTPSKSMVLSIATIFLTSANWSHAQLSKQQQAQSVAFLRAPGVCDGTGFFISGSYVLTASHVAKTVRMEIWVQGRRYYGTVHSRGQGVDWAVLKVTGYECKKPIGLAAPKTGEKTWAYGYPADGRLNITSGDLRFDGFVGMWSMPGQAQMGMSGGPVVNRQGRAIGIVSKMGPFGHTLLESSVDVAN